MKLNFFLILLIISYSEVIAQTRIEKIDSLAISYKAKLFTVSEFGIASEQEIMSNIQEQDLNFLKTVYKDFIFMKINFNQPYTLHDGSRNTFIRNCSYYIAYNIKISRFYRLGGFDYLDIDSFFKDLLDSEIIFQNLDGNEIENIDINCLYNYYKLNKSKRIRKKFNCFKECSEVTQLEYRDN